MESKSCEHGCSESCSGSSHGDCAEGKIASRLQSIGKKIVVLSGKGGVGKSTVAVNLAASLALSGMRVGLLDADIHGPSVPKMLRLEGERPGWDGESLLPVEKGSMKVMSVGFFLKAPEDAVIWRGPAKYSMLQQFLGDVQWGELDHLVIDCPPGTGDEPLTICQLIPNVDGAVVVTTPQDVATADVRRSIGFCRTLGIPVLGVVENMSGYVCPDCGKIVEIFKSGGGEQMARSMGVPFLCRLPLDPDMSIAGDDGTPFVHRFEGSPAAKLFEGVANQLL